MLGKFGAFSFLRSLKNNLLSHHLSKRNFILRVRSIGKSGFRFSKSKSGFPNRTRNPKTDFTSEKSSLQTADAFPVVASLPPTGNTSALRRLREIRPQGGFRLRNPNPDFLDFPSCRSIGKSEKGFAKLFS